MDFAQYPITLLIIIANVIFSFIGFSNQSLLSKTIGWPYYEKRDKQYYRMITSGFLHADWMHLIFNMFTLYFFGSSLEFYLSAEGLGGNISFLSVYFIGLIVANIPSYLKHNNNEGYRSLGASGAVSAVVFACIIFSPWSQIRLYGALKLSMVLYAILYVIYCVYMGKKNVDNVNHDAHLWGGVFGLVFMISLIAIRRPDCFPFIIEDLKNVQLFGTNSTSSLLQHLGFYQSP
jgi:membrane associated rhomboid family serine protease